METADTYFDATAEKAGGGQRMFTPEALKGYSKEKKFQGVLAVPVETETWCRKILWRPTGHQQRKKEENAKVNMKDKGRFLKN